MRNLYAFTHSPSANPRVDYPGYVSLNRQDDGTLTLDVRTHGKPDGSRIVLGLEQQLGLGRALVRLDTDPCIVPPRGWRCTRVGGHSGPCAAWPRWWNVVGWLRARGWL